MLHHSIPHIGLEIKGSLLEARVEFTVREDARVDVLLGEVAEVFVFGHDAFVDLGDEVELFVGGVFVAEDLVLHGGFGGGGGDEALDHEEVGAGMGVSMLMRLEEGDDGILRDVCRDVGEVVCTRHHEPSITLFLRRRWIMHNLSACSVDRV